MSNFAGKLFGFLLCLQCVTELHGVFIRFTNVSCHSKDLSMATVEYCELTTLSKTKNSIRLRYKLLEPGFHKLMLHLQLMTKGSESVDGAPNWQPFLYEINLDFCRFWKKNRSNHLAKMIFNFIEGHSNLNHSCPFLTEDYFAIEGITNTEISSKIHGLPMAKGFYALYTKWLTENITRIQTNYYFEVLSV